MSSAWFDSLFFLSSLLTCLLVHRYCGRVDSVCRVRVLGDFVSIIDFYYICFFILYFSVVLLLFWKLLLLLHKSLEVIGRRLTAALNSLSDIRETNFLHANPGKTRACAFHLSNRQAQRHLNVVWNGKKLANDKFPVYLGVAVDRTISYRTCQETRGKDRFQKQPILTT